MRPRVLLIEDNHQNRELARYLLDAGGFLCDEAMDGRSALALAAAHRPDVVVCDVRLPDIDGFEVLRKLRELPGCATVPIIAVTAYAMVGDRERMLGAGFDDYIAKPLDAQTFASRVRALLPQLHAAPVAPAGAHILVVDDREPNRRLLATVLGFYGYSVVEAADGERAWEELQSRPIDLVITDLLMPNMDGEELCRRIRSDAAMAQLPIIIHTASYRARQARQIGRRHGVQWVLPKPSEAVDILAAVTKSLGQDLPVGVQPREASVLAADPDIERLHERGQQLSSLLQSASELAAAQAHALARAVQADPAEHAMRQASLLRLGLDVSQARDPDELVDLVAASAQDVMSARYIGIAIVGADGTLRRFASRGLPRDSHERVAKGILACLAASRLSGPEAEGRMVVAATPRDEAGLPPEHPPVRNMVGCRVAAHGRAFGWLYAADRLGDEDGFTAEDERLLAALGSQLAVAWNSLLVLGDLEQQVQQRTRDLQEANTRLEAFSSLLSHDLQGPLHAVSAIAQLLQSRYAAQLPADAARYLGGIERNALQMRALTRDLLEFSRASSRGFEPGVAELDELLRECLAVFSEEIRSRAVVVEVERLPAWRCDPALLRQALLNLIGNALKYTRRQPNPRIRVEAVVADCELRLTVRDNGAGFDMAYADRLFQPFERLHLQSEFEGSGVGLMLAKMVVERHGGRIWADASPGTGAAFTIALPR